MRSPLLSFALSALLVAPSPARAQGSAPTELAPATVQRLTGLAQVWGFLKYFHPGVAQGTMDWDSVLVAAIPRVEAAQSPAQYAAIIQELIDAGGSVPRCSTCQQKFSERAAVNVDLRWMAPGPLFTPAIVERLRDIQANRHQGKNRFVTLPTPAQGTTFHDKPYAEMVYPDEPYRLLGLMRWWNYVEYYFPYKHINGGDWTDVLRSFIPRFASARDTVAYHLTALEAVSRLNDAHVWFTSRVISNELGGGSMWPKMVDGHLFFAPTHPREGRDSTSLMVGDEIVAVDGEPVAERRRRWEGRISAGGPHTYEREMGKRVVRSTRVPRSSSVLTIQRGERTLTRALPPFSTRLPVEFGDAVRILPGNVVYVLANWLPQNQLDSAIALMRGAAGIVIDARPGGAAMDSWALQAALDPGQRPVAMYGIPDPAHPGMLRSDTATTPASGASARSRYTGRIAILTDEYTQSQLEANVMVLQTIRGAKLVGTPTAGADGVVAEQFAMPGGLQGSFTSTAMYYPDGRQTQRIGLQPDILVRPTVAGMKAGRDEVLERALEYVRTGK